jgi:hypothetical protein
MTPRTGTRRDASLDPIALGKYSFSRKSAWMRSAFFRETYPFPDKKRDTVRRDIFNRSEISRRVIVIVRSSICPRGHIVAQKP